MNKAIAILLTSLFLSVGFSDLITILHFYGNRTFITENFCINRDQPEKKCKGKCYLKKQLEKNDNRQDDDLPVNRVFVHFEFKMLLTTTFIFGIVIDQLISSATWAFDHGLYDSGFCSKLIQPPEVIS